MKHSTKLGTIIAVCEGMYAVIHLPELNIVKKMKASELDRYLNELWFRDLI